MGEQLLPCRLFLSLWLLSALMNCKNIGYVSSTATLPQVEVDAINALLQLIPQTGPINVIEGFKNSDCGLKRNNSVSCDCNETTCRVTKLDFSYFGMIGEIPMQIGNLASLTYLDLSYNKLSKEIPSSFQNLWNVSYLLFNGNLLEGRIPTFFGPMKSLIYLSLTDNNFNGTIPPELGTLPSLQALYLDGNWLSGKIPYQLGDISNLGTLDLSDNLLFGEIPPHLGNLSNLQIMYFYNNQLSGELPIELGNLTNLERMSLSNNNFSGNLSQTFSGLKNMSYFNVRGNNFSGKIPDFIADWKSLYFLMLDGNNFEWPDPKVFQSLTELRILRLTGLTGGLGGERNFPFPNISASKNLTTLVLRNSSLVGPIPDFVSKIPSLNYLDLSFNNLTGEIPHFNGTYLFLRGNKLNNASQGWLSNLKDSYVDVSENLLTNLNLPTGKNVSKNWNFFSCCSGINNTNDTWKNADYRCDKEKPMYNQLYINCGGDRTTINETRYEADSQPEGGSTFILSDDKSWGYSSMGLNYSSYIVNKTYDVNMNDSALYTTARVAPISLKYFGFCLKHGKYTVKLHFAEISWNPKDKTNKEPGNMGIRIFDVEIQCIKVLTNFNITKEAGGVNKAITKVFNDVSVNGNKLEIHLYWTGKGSQISSRFPNVGPLISAISVSPAPVHGKKKLSALSIAGIVASALLVPILILAILWKLGLWKLGWFGRKQLQDEELKGIELLPSTFFNFRQIKDATQNFSSANKLGEGGFGSVYKGVLPNGTTIAVKQLSAKSGQGIREFVNEVGTISALQHPNLVMLLGCCAEDNQLLLIYEYMENNSLAHALFGPGELRSRLNWPTRVKICLGIAKGLAFLHEESKLKIVHRDIKPTNILLDTNLNAKISDFGFAKLYEGEMTHVVTKIAGTTGYMAPEYAMRGHLTSKADVYSFGVVTLEIVSGKNSASYRPNDENVYLLDLAYVLQEKGNIIELVDPTLGSNYSSVEAVTILELAMLCTNPSLSLRPTMSEVVKILEGKSKIVATPVSGPSQEGTSNANSSQAVSKEVEEWPLLDDSRMAKSMPDFSRSTKLYSTLQEETSNANSSQAVSKEVEEWPLLDDLTMAKSMPDFSRSTKFYSTSQERTSNSNSSQVVSKEVEEWPLLDDSRMANSMSDFSQSAQFYSTSQEGTSNANKSQAVSKEVEKSETFF